MTDGLGFDVAEVLTQIKARTCDWCSDVLDAELRSLALDVESSGRLPTRHGHRLYVIATGTCWRFYWAPTAADAVAMLRPPKGARIKARLARAQDLVAVKEATG